MFSLNKKTTATKVVSPVSNNTEMQTLQGVFNAIGEGLIYFDQKGVIKLINESAARLAGWTAQDAMGIDVGYVFKLVDPKMIEIPAESNPFRNVILQRKEFKINSLSILNKNNQGIPVDLSITPILVNGYAVDAVAVIKDVTTMQNEENRLKDFISTASHEMRTPIASTDGFLELALNPKTATIDNRAKDYLLKSKEALKRLGVLFDELLTATSADDGVITSAPKVIELGKALKAYTDALIPIVGKKGMTVEYHIGSKNPGDIVPVGGAAKQLIPNYYTFVDPNKLSDVLGKLFDNAMKFSKSGKILVGISSDDNFVQVYIKDSGIGISAENLPHIFQKFYRVDNSPTRTIGGSGLGLYTCKKVIEFYKGKIWAESVLGQGSTFYFTIPKLTDEQAKQFANAQVAK